MSAHHITVTGIATEDVCPDEVKLTFGVDTFDAKLTEAMKKSETASSGLVTAIKALGIKDCHIQMERLTVEIQYESRSLPVAPCTGYCTRRSYTITLEKNNLDLLEKLVAASLGNGANRLSNLTANVVNYPTIKRELQRQAAKAARAKAELIAGELGAKVGGPIHIEEVDANSSQARSLTAYGGGHSGGSMPLGNVTVAAAVKVDFQLLA